MQGICNGKHITSALQVSVAFVEHFNEITGAGRYAESFAELSW